MKRLCSLAMVGPATPAVRVPPASLIQTLVVVQSLPEAVIAVSFGVLAFSHGKTPFMTSAYQ